MANALRTYTSVCLAERDDVGRISPYNGRKIESSVIADWRWDHCAADDLRTEIAASDVLLSSALPKVVASLEIWEKRKDGGSRYKARNRERSSPDTLDFLGVS